MRAKGYWQKASERVEFMYAVAGVQSWKKIAVWKMGWNFTCKLDLSRRERESGAARALFRLGRENEHRRREDAPHRFTTSIFLFYNKLLKLLLQTQTQSEESCANYAAPLRALHGVVNFNLGNGIHF